MTFGILFLCREVPYTTGASHTLLVPFAEKKVSRVSTRDLELHCWYAHDVFSIPLFNFFMSTILLYFTIGITCFVWYRVLDPI